MHIGQIAQTAVKTVKNNMPIILTGLGIAGVVGTAFLTGKGCLEADKKLKKLEEEKGRELTAKEKAKETWKYYVPAALAGAGTIAAIVGSNRVSAHQIAAIMTVAKTAEDALIDNREGVKELFGEKGLRKLDEKVNEKQMMKYVNNENYIYETGKGKVLCCDGFLTGVLFRASADWVRRCVNEFNARLISGEQLCWNDFLMTVIPNIDPDILPNAGALFEYNLDVRKHMLEIVEDSFMNTEFNEPCYIFNVREIPLFNLENYH